MWNTMKKPNKPKANFASMAALLLIGLNASGCEPEIVNNGFCDHYHDTGADTPAEATTWQEWANQSKYKCWCLGDDERC